MTYSEALAALLRSAHPHTDTEVISTCRDLLNDLEEIEEEEEEDAEEVCGESDRKPDRKATLPEVMAAFNAMSEKHKMEVLEQLKK